MCQLSHSPIYCHSFKSVMLSVLTVGILLVRAPKSKPSKEELMAPGMTAWVRHHPYCGFPWNDKLTSTFCLEWFTEIIVSFSAGDSFTPGDLEVFSRLEGLLIIVPLCTRERQNMLCLRLPSGVTVERDTVHRTKSKLVLQEIAAKPHAT